MEELFLPVLHSFENNNVFTGSYGALRFKVTPAITMKNPKEVDMEASSMLCPCFSSILINFRYHLKILLSYP